MKEYVYEIEVPMVEILRESIDAAFVQVNEEIYLKVTAVEIRKICRACIRNRGAQFEHNLNNNDIDRYKK